MRQLFRISTNLSPSERGFEIYSDFENCELDCIPSYINYLQHENALVDVALRAFALSGVSEIKLTDVENTESLSEVKSSKRLSIMQIVHLMRLFIQERGWGRFVSDKKIIICTGWDLNLYILLDLKRNISCAEFCADKILKCEEITNTELDDKDFYRF